jgi:hypothetical protein
MKLVDHYKREKTFVVLSFKAAVATLFFLDLFLTAELVLR